MTKWVVISEGIYGTVANSQHAPSKAFPALTEAKGAFNCLPHLKLDQNILLPETMDIFISPSLAHTILSPNRKRYLQEILRRLEEELRSSSNLSSGHECILFSNILVIFTDFF